MATDLSSFNVTGTNNSSKQVSVNYQNAMLRAIEGLPSPGTLSFDSFGAVPNDSSSSARAANNAAWDALKLYVTGLGWGAFYSGAPRIIFPSESYYWAETILVDQPLWLSGNNLGFPGAIATQFYFPVDTCGMKIDSPAIVEGFFFEPASTGAKSILNAGIRLRSRATVRNCWISAFPGSGILVNADALAGGESAGNANGWQVRDVRIQNCKYSGMYIQGGDVNAGMAMNVDIAQCGRFGVEELSFLGNMFINIQVDDCGTIDSPSGSTAWVSDGTHIYTLVYGQDANAASTPPTAGTDNAVWKLEALGGAAINCPLYATHIANGGTFESGGSYYAAGSNQRSVFEGCYHEGNQPRPRILAPSFASGGFMGGFHGDGEYLVGTGLGLQSQNGFRKGAVHPGTGVSMIAGVGANDYSTVLHAKHDTYAAAGWKLFSFGVNDFRPQDLWLHYNNIPLALLTGPTTLEEFGTGAAQPNVFHATSFALGGYNDGSARKMTYADAAPTSGLHARGEIVWNNAPSAAGTLGWTCVTSGTPGTWKAISGIAA